MGDFKTLSRFLRHDREGKTWFTMEEQVVQGSCSQKYCHKRVVYEGGSQQSRVAAVEKAEEACLLKEERGPVRGWSGRNSSWRHEEAGSSRDRQVARFSVRLVKL